MAHMTDTDIRLTVPPWTLGWRLRRALAFAHMTTDQMAVELTRSRGTMSNWINDVTTPPRLYIREWATITGVPYEWLLEGDGPPPGDSHGEQPDSTSQLSYSDFVHQGSLRQRLDDLAMAN